MLESVGGLDLLCELEGAKSTYLAARRAFDSAVATGDQAAIKRASNQVTDTFAAFAAARLRYDQAISSLNYGRPEDEPAWVLP